MHARMAGSVVRWHFEEPLAAEFDGVPEADVSAHGRDGVELSVSERAPFTPLVTSIDGQSQNFNFIFG